MMSFREKSTWSCLLSTLVIYTWYFVVAFGVYEAGEAISMNIVFLFLGAVVAQIIALGVAHAVFVMKSPPEAADERDLQIEMRSLKYSHAVLSLGVTVAILGNLAHAVAGDAGASTLLLTPFVLAHGLLLFFVLAELLYYGTQVFYYRRGV